MPRAVSVTTALLAAILLLPGGLQGQRRGRQPQAPSRAWAPASVAGQIGYDDVSNANLVGAQIRIPLLRSGRLEIAPGGNVTFATGLKEYQLNVDAAYTLGGRNRGLYVAGGLAVRNTVFDGPDRETKTGFGLATGLKAGGATGPGLQIEYRQIFVDSRLKPRILAFGLIIPLWGWDRQAR